MKKKWNDSPLSDFDYPMFNIYEHLVIANNTNVIIRECIFNTQNSDDLINNIYSKPQELLQNLGFNNVIIKAILFEDVVFDSNLISSGDCEIKFKNCNFYEDAIFKNYKSIQLINCFFKNGLDLIDISDNILIYESRINKFLINTNSMIEVSDSFVEEFDVLGEESPNSNEFIKECYFTGYIEKELNIFSNQTFGTFELICDSYSDDNGNLQTQFGEIQISFGIFQDYFLVTQNNRNNGSKINTSIKSITLDFANLIANKIDILKCNVGLLKFMGNNNSVPVYISDNNIDKISFENYQMDKEGLISFRNIVNKTGLLQSKDTLISNRKLFFQNCDLSEWKSHFTGTFFEYQAISSSMPTKIKDERNLTSQEKLDIHNLWLKNTNKEENIINWHELKRKQFQTIWEVEKEKANRTEKGLPPYKWLQKFVQELNDYGTNWWKPATWLICINFFAALYSTYVLKVSFEEGKYFFVNNFVSFINPLKFDIPPFQFSYFSFFLLLLKIANATLIFQIVSAFRVYYKK